ncbi:SPOR domain-containing protein [Aerolutibacter ruishenii]|uniref:Sporulation related protein n=1 Tax=Aerolutibacter ruishenii TaxID=686800 RepID=A0A562M309_9GAMM|nr:SPOR domain-containing protein [Lysobacter ruishenii]TWI14337.1 sporulation related protein [Lysobacter ruishenii]
MFIRALIVLLLVLNLGVAAWWHWSTPAAPQATGTVPPGVGQLQLLRERDEAVVATPATAARAPSATGPGSPAVTTTEPTGGGDATTVAAPQGIGDAGSPELPTGASRCYRFGPFDSEDALVAAQATLKPLTQALLVQRPPLRPGRGWRVYLPPLASAEEATAIAGRVSAAGFRDYFIVREGAEANSVALGRFGSETAARRHADALNAAGFAARAEPLGAGAGAAWVDVRAAAGFDAEAVRIQVRAARAQPADCATLRWGVGVPLG